MVREIYTEMKKQNKKIEIESERETLQGRDEAERLYAADAEAALNEFRPDMEQLSE
jgi:hypothetical protein